MAIIGGGFSGLLAAINLLTTDPRVRVRLIERQPPIGGGRAYRTASPDHLLNVRASNMSAFPDRPDHFKQWLSREHGEPEGADVFVSRRLYGAYLYDLLRDACSGPGADRLQLHEDEALSLERTGGAWRIGLASGAAIDADAVILALGLLPPRPPSGAGDDVLASPRYIADPWAADLTGLPEGDILLIGAGLTMVDVALTLASGSRRLLAVSRRGLLPRSHAPTAAAAAPTGSLDTPLAALRTLRGHAAGVGWRAAVDSIRPQTQAVWQGWSQAEQRRFLRHAQPWWDVHRHRMAPVVADRIAALVREDRLGVAAGRIEALGLHGQQVEAVIRPRGRQRAAARRFAAVVNCTGPQGDVGLITEGLLADLCRRGMARADPLGLGLALGPELQLIDARGHGAPGLYAVGPLTRGRLWEAVAVPDLRSQTAQVAGHVLDHLRSVAAVLAMEA